MEEQEAVVREGEEYEVENGAIDGLEEGDRFTVMEYEHFEGDVTLRRGSDQKIIGTDRETLEEAMGVES
ncbi:MAG: hypothetical protein SV760_09095 [Halobacteria archaeon]|nr:hypothetical protein [Halobacteria archaeon]